MSTISRQRLATSPAAPRVAAAGPELSGRRLAIGAVLFYGAHVPLALVERQAPIVGTIHALVTLAVGLVCAVSSRRSWYVACAGAYIAGAEILWRMTDAPLFWEFGKYAMSLLFLLAALRLGWGKISWIAVVYFASLLPSAAITIANDPSVAVNHLSFNLSGPFALMASVLFFSCTRPSLAQFRRLLLVAVAPIVGVGVIVLKGMRGVSDIDFKGSNDATSGGFAPNQVSAILGFAVLLLALYLLTSRTGILLGTMLFALLLLFGTLSAMTFSRGGLYFAGSSAAVAGAYLLRERRHRARLALGAAFVASIALLVVIPQLMSLTKGAIADRFSDTYTTGRAEIAKADLETWREHPILGVGPGEAKEARARFFRREASHTEFTRLLAEHGLFGLVALLCLIALVGRALVTPAPLLSKALRAAMLTWSLLFMAIDGVRLAAPGFAFGLSFAMLAAVPPRRSQRLRLGRRLGAGVPVGRPLPAAPNSTARALGRRGQGA